MRIIVWVCCAILMVGCGEKDEDATRLNGSPSDNVQDGNQNNNNPPPTAPSSDTTPEPFSFIDVTEAQLSTSYSASITVAGIDAPAAISITNGEYSIDGGEFVNGAGNVDNGQLVAVRMISAPTYSTTTNSQLTIGGISDTFSLTTLAAPPEPSPSPPPSNPPSPAGQGGIAFTDLVSGPASGLGDGLGSGVIVTLWGWFGTTQGDSTIEFCDVNDACREGYVYYWKNADGQLPGGPANLFESHGLQEIAFSIPADSAVGPGVIRVSLDGVDYDTPFTVREGAIFHVTSSGNDNADGSFLTPMASASHATDEAPIGGTVYVHDVNSGQTLATRAIYKAANSPRSNQDSQFALVSYPGFHPTYTAREGIQGYQQEAIVVSKATVFASNRIEGSNGQPGDYISGNGPTFAIKGSAFGRAVGNKVTDIPGHCASRTQGAITTTALFYDYASDFRIYGNEVYDYGCYGSNKLHHTTYFSLRSDDDLQSIPPHVMFNYFHGNDAKNGIHFHDQDTDCGDYTQPVYIHDNVIINQGGAAITYQSSGCERLEDTYIYNNVILNAGLPAAWDGIDPNTSDGHDGNGITIWDSGLYGTMNVYNNTVLGWNRDGISSGSGCIGFRGAQDNVRLEFNDNMCIAYYDRQFVGIGYRSETKDDNIYGGDNIFYYVGEISEYPNVFDEALSPGINYPANPAMPSNATLPSSPNLTNHILGDPQLTVVGSQVQMGTDSVAKDNSDSALNRDVYGNPRAATHSTGAVE